MALRKCPSCKNLIAAETESCPICGCEPRARRRKQVLAAVAALAGVILLLHGQIRQQIPGLYSPTPANAQTAVAPR
jgi:uncharacterized paraquat-inducible protein A